MPSEQPTKDDIARFLETWLSLNIAEAISTHAPHPTDEERAAVRRVVRWLESIVTGMPTPAQMRAYDMMVEETATKLYPLPPFDASQEAAP